MLTIDIVDAILGVAIVCIIVIAYYIYDLNRQIENLWGRVDYYRGRRSEAVAKYKRLESFMFGEGMKHIGSLNAVLLLDAFENAENKRRGK